MVVDLKTTLLVMSTNDRLGTAEQKKAFVDGIVAGMGCQRSRMNVKITTDIVQFQRWIDDPVSGSIALVFHLSSGETLDALAKLNTREFQMFGTMQTADTLSFNQQWNYINYPWVDLEVYANNARFMDDIIAWSVANDLVGADIIASYATTSNENIQIYDAGNINKIYKNRVKKNGDVEMVESITGKNYPGYAITINDFDLRPALYEGEVFKVFKDIAFDANLNKEIPNLMYGEFVSQGMVRISDRQGQLIGWTTASMLAAAGYGVSCLVGQRTLITPASKIEQTENWGKNLGKTLKYIGLGY